MSSCSLMLYSEFLSLTFPIPIYDYFHETRNDNSHLKLYLISSYRDRNVILFGILIGSPTNDAFYYPEILGYLAKLEKSQQISKLFSGWPDPQRYFIRNVLCDEKIISRHTYINNTSPIGAISLPLLINIEKLAVSFNKADKPIKLVSHYALRGERGFLVLKNNRLHILNQYGQIELEDTANFCDDVQENERLFLNWARQIMRDHFLTEPFVIGFIYTQRRFVVDLIGVKHDNDVRWQSPVFSVGCFHLNIVDIRKCPIYTVYLNGSTSYRQQIQTVIIDALRACPVKPYLNAPMNITTDLYWTVESESSIRQFYYLKHHPQ